MYGSKIEGKERITPPPDPTFASGPKMFLKTNALFSKTFEGPGKEATHPPFHTRTRSSVFDKVARTKTRPRRTSYNLYINYVARMFYKVGNHRGQLFRLSSTRCTPQLTQANAEHYLLAGIPQGTPGICSPTCSAQCIG